MLLALTMLAAGYIGYVIFWYSLRRQIVKSAERILQE